MQNSRSLSMSNVEYWEKIQLNSEYGRVGRYSAFYSEDAERYAKMAWEEKQRRRNVAPAHLFDMNR